MNNEAKSQELQNLAVEVGQFIHYWGFKKIHGRLWTHLFLANTPPDAAQLMKQLNVSKALISLSLNDLLEFNVIQEAGKSEKGRQTYVTNPQILDVIMDILRNREQKLLMHVQSAYKKCAVSDLNDQDVNTDRLIMLGQMIDLAQKALNCILDLGSLDLSAWNSVRENLLGETSSN